jgi:hypothetical protein
MNDGRDVETGIVVVGPTLFCDTKMLQTNLLAHGHADLVTRKPLLAGCVKSAS